MAEKKKRQHRDAGSGEYVTERYAKKHPKTTVSEPRGNGSGSRSGRKRKK